MTALARFMRPRAHYGWVVVALTFLLMLTTAAVRSTPGVLILPLEQDFGWDRATISAAVSLNLLLYGLIGPFAGELMQRIGLRRTILIALSTVLIGLLLTTQITHVWQLVVVWGGVIGAGTGMTALVLGATVVNRWFATRRGLAIGFLTASSATGQLLFLPPLALIVTHVSWQAAVFTVAIATAILVPLIATLLPERPADIDLAPYGAEAQVSVTPNIHRAIPVLRDAIRVPDFWLLFASFFVCGATTNGLIGTHLIAACADHGIAEVTAAGLLAMMGIFDFVGTVGSGWMSDRFSNRHLLFWYYALRGLSLFFLPFAFDAPGIGLPIFAVFYGLDWIATVPPTVRLCSEIFGRDRGPVVFGWVFAGHQIGAAMAALGAGIIRQSEGSYLPAFLVAGATCIVGALLVLGVRSTPRANVLAA